MGNIFYPSVITSYSELSFQTLTLYVNVYTFKMLSIRNSLVAVHIQVCIVIDKALNGLS